MTILEFEKKYNAKWKWIENQFYINKLTYTKDMKLENQFIEWFGFTDDLKDIKFFYNRISLECMEDLVTIWKELKINNDKPKEKDND